MKSSLQLALEKDGVKSITGYISESRKMKSGNGQWVTFNFEYNFKHIHFKHISQRNWEMMAVIFRNDIEVGKTITVSLGVWRNYPVLNIIN